jgi:hypothetical protein
MKKTSLQVLGLLGIGGALLMFFGDMCLYGHWGSGGDFASNLPLVLSDESDGRIILGGFIAPIAVVLYFFGFYSVYRMIAPKSRMLAILVAGSAAVMMLFGGTYHAMWSIRALLIKAGLSTGEYQGMYSQIKDYTLLFYDTMLVVGGIGFLLLLFAVVSGKSLYPRWTAIVNPGFLFMLYFLTSDIPAPLGAIIHGGYLNLVSVVFFSVSLISSRTITEGVPG